MCLLQIVLFLLTEVIPILFSLQRMMIQRLSEKNFDVTISGAAVSTKDTGFGPGAVMFNAASNGNSSSSSASGGTRSGMHDVKVPLLAGSSSDRGSQSHGSGSGLGRSPNTSSFNMLYAGRDSAGGVNHSDVCIESPVTSQDFIHLYGSSHSAAAVQESTGGAAQNSVDTSHYRGKESFDDQYPQDRLTSSDYYSDRSSYVTAQTGRSPNSSWAGWLGF